MNPFLRKLALIGAAILLSLLFVEGSLQLGSLFVGSKRGSSWSHDDRIHVLCIGDSNTYGLSVGNAETYPARLQATWEQKSFEPKIEVLNIGIPGMNSSQVLRDLDRNIDLFEPDVVVIAIGVNDFWTLPVKTTAVEPESLLGRLKRWSRLYRLYYIATRDPGQRPVEFGTDESGNQALGRLEVLGETFETRVAKTDVADKRTGEQMASNLREIVATVQARGVLLVLANYASDTEFYDVSNYLLGLVAQETATPLANVRKVFRNPSVCPTEPCPSWIFPLEHPAKAHPTSAGYQLVANEVLRVLRTLLPRPGAGKV
ncbi:MAG: SGNH/GDSL hydrolase family protein [Candidatus Binatia bacterium]